MAAGEQTAQESICAHPPPEPAQVDRQVRQSARESWVVVGHGMVAQWLCERIVDGGLLERIDLTLIGEEASPPYDRVNLSRALRTGCVEPLVLRPFAWFIERGITRFQGRAAAIDREGGQVFVEGGQSVPYDRLVLATGSRAILPDLAGTTDPRVFVYRTLEDALSLRAAVLALPAERRRVLVVGAGLLGLETAEALHELGCSVCIVEGDDHLLPRQLDAESSLMLREKVEARGFSLRVGTKVRAITTDADEELAVELGDGTRHDAALVVFAVGVRPRDDLARQAGLTCDLFGGVVVNESLRTSDPRIFALGECARYGGQCFGLVAPGYAMAEVLVDRIRGRAREFTGWQPSLRLKLQGAEVAAMGESNAVGLDVRSVVRRRGDEHVRLVIHHQRITGLSAIGTPADLPALQQALARGDRISARACRRFERGEALFRAETIDVRSWPRETTVCSCLGVTCGTLEDARLTGAGSVETLMARTGAGTSCGSCRPLLAGLLGEAPVREGRAVPYASAAGTLLLLMGWLLAAPLPWPAEVSAVTWFERLGALAGTFFWKQLTGWSLLAVLAVVGAYSFRGKLRSVTGRRAFRVVHLVLGALAALLAAAHTGLRLGSGMDALLAVVLVLVSAGGALAAVTLAARPSPGAGERRRQALRLHSWLTWPLPALVLLHVLKVYWF